MRRILTYGSLVFASLAVIAAFVTATTYLQLGVAVVLYPILVYLVYKTMPRKVPQLLPKKPLAAILQPINPRKEEAGISDIDRRGFLKLIGAAGLSFFLFSIFSKRAEIPFFGKIIGPETTPTADSPGSLVEVEPTVGYRISEIDDGETTFYGFINKDGAWFIMKEDADTGSFRYVRGDSGFPGKWTGRESLKYDYFHNVF